MVATAGWPPAFGAARCLFDFRARAAHFFSPRTTTSAIIIPSRLLLLTAFGFTLAADDKKPTTANATVFREPFTLKLRLDKDRYYEQKIPKTQFVIEDNVYLFVGEKFGIVLEIDYKGVFAIHYQPDEGKADVFLEIREETAKDGSASTTLILHNKTKYTLNMDTILIVPDRQGMTRTRIPPIQPGSTNHQTWPHAIIQLCLCNIQVVK